MDLNMIINRVETHLNSSRLKLGQSIILFFLLVKSISLHVQPLYTDIQVFRNMKRNILARMMVHNK